jgi:uncharacterized protein YdaL
MKINSYNSNEQYINLKEKSDTIAENKNILNIKEQKNNMNAFETDSIEISENSKQLNSIKNKIEDGFYNHPNILQKVAEKILNTMNEQI